MWIGGLDHSSYIIIARLYSPAYRAELRGWHLFVADIPLGVGMFADDWRLGQRG